MNMNFLFSSNDSEFKALFYCFFKNAMPLYV